MLRWVVALAFAPGCCSAAGCSGELVIFFDRPLATGASVTVDLGEGSMDCAALEDSGSRLESCRLREVDGRSAVVVPTGASEVPELVVVTIAEGEAPPVSYEVAPVRDEPYFPNGKSCGPSCESGEAELVLDGPG